MNFRPELAQAVLDGRKTVTRRLVSPNPRSPWFEGGCSLKVDHTYAVCPGRGKNAIGRARIVGVRREPLGWLSDDEAQCEGFPHAMAFAEAWGEINGGYYRDQLVWRVEIAAVPDEDLPLWEAAA